MINRIKIYLFLIAGLFAYSCSDSGTSPNEQTPQLETTAKITLVEFGSITCEPCKEMQPILEATRQKYDSSDVDVRFIDLNKNSDMGNKYKIVAMPTQVFFDVEGYEFYRHIGVLSQIRIDSLLKTKGIVAK
jgi:thioredoxin 1